MVFNVHLFTNENDVTNAIATLDIVLGYPRGDAQHYTGYYQHGEYYYILADDLTAAYLPNPIEQLTINYDDTY